MHSDRPTAAISTSYYIRIPNVGDRASPMLVNAVANRPVVHVRDQSKPHLFAIGSIMGRSTPQSVVWGSGAMYSENGTGGVLAHNVHALRGHLSRSALVQSGMKLPDVPFGDPGYLVPRLLGINRSAAPRYRVGLVSHYVDRNYVLIRKLLNEDGVLDLNVHDEPRKFLADMADCEVVISTSLHGLIFAEALGLPNLWAGVSDEIPGSGFKFRDWYSTTHRPQAARREILQHDTAEALSREAEPRESTIDAEALLSAFPYHRLEELETASQRSTIAINECRQHPIPVFLISFNRGDILLKTIASIRGLDTATEIIVHDNGSTCTETLAILDNLRANGITVYDSPAIHAADELNSVNDTIQAYFADWSEPTFYIVSDCDIDMSETDPKAIELYIDLLSRFRRVDCVGPMLRIRDIPKDYPLRNHAMNRQIEEFWRKSPRIIETDFGEVAVNKCKIDTTFAVHRPGEEFRRLKRALRVYAPFEARHLDWYTSGDSDYAAMSNPAISHGDNRAAFELHRNDVLEHDGFKAVRRNAAGHQEIYIERIFDAATGPLKPAFDE